MTDSTKRKRQVLREIHEKLTELWDDPTLGDLEVLLKDLGIRGLDLDFRGTGSNIWYRAVLEAAKRGKLEALIEKSGDRFPPQAEELGNLWRDFHDAPGEIWLRPLDPEAYPLDENCPYVGLRRFEEKDRMRFFGRDALVQEILERIESAPLHLVLGHSGSGKSSVVRAGVIPKWREANGNDARAIVFTPDVDPFTGFFAGLLGAGYDQAEAGLARKISPTVLRDVAAELRKDGEPPWFIFIDQFEEIFTRIPPEGKEARKRDQFIASIVDLAEAEIPGVHLVLAMRDDFFGNLRAHKDLFPLTDNHLIRITEMDGESLLEVIERPAVEHGVGFEGELAEKIAREVEGRPGMLPLLQHTLEALWEKDDVTDRVLNLESYHAIGGVKGALNQKATRYYEGLDEEQRQSLRRILLGLVEIGQTEAGWRPVSRRARKSDLVSEADQEILGGLLDREKLLISSGEDDPSIELAHEALIAGWPQFSEWVRESREAIELRNRLRHDAETWRKAEEKDPRAAEAELWHGSKLELGLELQAAGDFERLHVPLGPDQEEFLTASQEFRDAARQREISRLRKFLMVAGALAIAAIAG